MSKGTIIVVAMGMEMGGEECSDVRTAGRLATMHMLPQSKTLCSSTGLYRMSTQWKPYEF